MSFQKIITKFNIFFLLVILIAVFTYFFNLSTIPSGFYSDEAVVGYNAYSILETGRDEYGKFFPILFKFFGSYTPGLFVYFLVPFIKIFGLSVTTVRGVNAFLMIGTGFILYYFLRNLLPKQNKYLLLCALLCYYLTPWTVFNARLGYETTFAYFLFCLSVYFLSRKKISIAFTILSLSTYAAHPNRYLAPLVILIYFLIFRPSAKKYFHSLIPAILIQIPHFILIFTPAFWVKGSYLNINFINQYLTFFSPSNIFYSEDHDPQRSVPQIAIFYFWQLIPLIFGIINLFKNRHRHIYQLIIILLLLSPLPASLANANYATQRALAMLFPYSIIMSLGIIELLQRNNIYKYLFILIIAFSYLLLWRSYFIFLPKERSAEWYGGFKEVTKLIVDHPEWHFLFDNSHHIPHIEYLFFSKYPPQKYQQENGILKNYYYDTYFPIVHNFNNLEIRTFVWKDDIFKPQVMISDKNAFSEAKIKEYCLTKVFEYKDYYGQPLLLGYLTNPEWKKNCNQQNNNSTQN